MRTLLCAGILLAVASAAHAAVIGKATVTADQAPIMRGDETIATVKKGDILDVTKVKGNWFGLDPSQGWIHKSHVRYDPILPASPAAPPVLAPAGGQKELTLDLGGGVTMKMVLIRPAKFMMGEGEGAFSRHEVTISKPFYMGVTEVTQAQYEAVMGTNPSKFKGAANPVETVSWDDATKFCEKLSEKTRQTIRLPTEAEWEYACRAGTQTAFSFGDNPSALGDYAWWGGNSGKTTHPVGQKKPNSWGLYDMNGNVWEWCADWFGDPYPKGPVTDPSGPTTGGSRVVRGGSGHFVAVGFRCADRGYCAPAGGSDGGGGFRCAMTLPSAPAAAQPAPAAPMAETPEASERMERIRVEGIKRAGQAGAKPVIMMTDENGMIILLQGSVFTEEYGRFVLRDGDFVVNAGKRPIPVFGTTLKQGEAGTIRNGKCTKVAPIVP